jgi:hypothetical protein
MNSVYDWYVVALIPWLGLTVPPGTVAPNIVRAARLVFVVIASVFAFRYVPIPTWIGLLFRGG